MNEKIHIGDIVIFDGGDNWLSKSICWLTKSTVSHAALVYDKDKIVEMGGSGIAVNRFTAESGTEAHLLRLKPEMPGDKLANAAKVYVDEGIGYDFPSLVILAGMLIYRDIRPTPKWQKATDLILTGACVILDKLLNKLTHKGTPVKTMVCSQMVYQVYLDCGKDYKIEIKDSADKLTANQGEYICLADLAQQSEATNDNASFMLNEAPADADYDDIEAISEQLYEALHESETDENDMLLQNVSLDQTVSKVQHFMELLEKIMEVTHMEIPLPALFVTPADLYERAVNLDLVCDFKLRREKN